MSTAASARIHERIKTNRLATGEHEYTRYGFRLLLEYNAVDIWQPDISWCGGLSELRHIGALAAPYNIPVIPHGDGQMVRRIIPLPTPIARGAKCLCLRRADRPRSIGGSRRRTTSRVVLKAFICARRTVRDSGGT